MTDRLSDDLIARINTRLVDDWRRTGEGDWLRTPKDRRRRSEQTSVVGTLLGALVESAAAAQAAPLKPIERLDEAAIAKVEKKLGFGIPGSLRDLTVRVGDGNFGPFNGIRRLANWAKDYAALRADLPAERGREWPAHMLPIVYLNGRRICLDRDTGAVVLWTKPPKKASEKTWAVSFVPQSPSLEEWLARWVDTPTECEGGPPGGWTPPESELARREAVAQAASERQAAANQKARTFALADHPPLADSLMQRLRDRAADPARRTTTSGLPSRPGLLSRMMGGLGLGVFDTPGPGTVMGFAAAGHPGPPPGEQQRARAEAALGFALPAPLRQLYSIADGGFGPGDAGLWPLETVVETYGRYATTPQGPNDEPWPAKYLPIAEADPAVYCLDLATGAVVVHDVQEMEHLGRGQWERSFKRESSSLSEWLDDWLGQKTMAQALDDDTRTAMRAAEARPPSPVTGYPMQFDDPAQQAEAEVILLSHADASLRASFGLPAIGWEDEVRRRHGVR